MLITTLLGPVEEETLTKEVDEKKTPDGKAITTRYFLEGELVRQDFKFEVEKSPAIGGYGWKGR